MILILDMMPWLGWQGLEILYYSRYSFLEVLLLANNHVNVRK